MKDFLADCPRDILYSNLKPLSEKRTADRFAQVAGHGCDVAPFLRSDEDAAVAAKLPQTHVVGGNWLLYRRKNRWGPRNQTSVDRIEFCNRHLGI